MSFLSAIILGLVQGIAEFLPISSSGHLAILENFFGLSTAENGHFFFDVLLHLGTLISVCVVYRRDIAGIVTDTVSYVRSIGHPVPGGPKEYPGARLLLMMVIATLPLVLVLPFKSVIEGLDGNTVFIGFALIVTGFVLFASDRMKNGRRTARNMSLASALLVGLAQALATIPGLSRSGFTISTGMAAGLRRDFAARFSFLVSIPAVLGANILSLIDAAKEGVDASLIPVYLVGMLAAMVSGYFAVSLVQRICRRGQFGKFSYYCWFIGALAIILSFVL